MKGTALPDSKRKAAAQAGQAFAETEPFNLRSLRTSTGAEVRVMVPMLNVPFRLIYAFNFYRDIYQPARAFKFAVGTTF